ncbi:MAG: spermidine/putrescine ABC transporter permease component I [Candidatus Improbicoccus pseudotrichonymphae]|uniref:Spermidine/putrescine ABC transporter permease component I n=1 Tax=Candidatus Improbicoccus pseudotrichonymphae TaxID=3033792 RepID=A0AA48I106_9FIRM|nr:MAG: spermidine/putrescine ABC transporter permease component I [Candidatus Improbicoccus pseudotrichonymphae]
MLDFIKKPKFLSLPYIIWMIAFCFLPSVLILYFSLVDKNLNFTLNNFVDIFEYSSIFLRSLRLSFISTFFCFIFGYSFVLIISRFEQKIQNTLIILTTIPNWINFLLKIYALMTILESNGILNFLLNKLGFPNVNLMNTPKAIVFGLVYNCLPYMIIPIHASISKIDKNIIESAKDLGANNFKIFTKIIFPLSVPGIISGFLITFIPSMSAFAISKMLGGKITMIGELIELKFIGGEYNPHSGSALAVFFIILTLLISNVKSSKNKKIHSI